MIFSRRLKVGANSGVLIDSALFIVNVSCVVVILFFKIL